MLITWELELRVIIEVVVATLLGGLIGIEREISDKPAGLRTLMLVAGASAALMSVGEILEARYQTGLDPTRVIQAIVTGISFLGAGTIIRRGRESEHVEGLTTAATILAAATVGICIASDLYVIGAGLTLISLLTLTVIKRVFLRYADNSGASREESQGPS